MSRIIHYKITKYHTFGEPTYTEHNIEIGGKGDITKNQVRLIRRKIMREAPLTYDIDEGNIIICNIINLRPKR